MSSSNIIQGPKHLDPLFPIPEGLVDYEYGSVPEVANPDYLIEQAEGAVWEETELLDESDLVDDGDADIIPELDVPDQVTVVSQTIRTQPSGMQVVDVVIDVEDVAGAVNYEFRIVKM